jgi:hypothetical protein
MVLRAKGISFLCPINPYLFIYNNGLLGLPQVISSLGMLLSQPMNLENEAKRPGASAQTHKQSGQLWPTLASEVPGVYGGLEALPKDDGAGKGAMRERAA